jgi:hypothetical protein
VASHIDPRCYLALEIEGLVLYMDHRNLISQLLYCVLRNLHRIRLLDSRQIAVETVDQCAWELGAMDNVELPSVHNTLLGPNGSGNF